MSALAAYGLGKSFGGVRAIDEVSFAVEDGSLTALIGPNGAGKTTLFNLITNLIPADAGEVRFFGTALLGKPQHEIARLGLLRTFQTARVFPGMTVFENVLLGAHRHAASGALGQMLRLHSARSEEHANADRARALLDAIGLGALGERPATALPLGLQKLVEICRALMARPRLLLLDEPAAGLNDAETAELAALLQALRHNGITILLVEHNMPLVASVADRVIVLDLGRVIASGTAAEIQRDPRVVAAYLGPGAAAA
jgi:branched-chain amino acid transport system ATP-binding protein